VDYTENKLTCLSLCAGYGGIELGLRLAGIEFGRVVYVERECFAAANLVNKIEEGRLAPGVVHTDVKTFPYDSFRGCFDYILGGIPCQPFSQAGSHKADEDPRHLFPHIKYAVRTVQPKFVLIENVQGIISAKLKGDQWADPAGTPVLLHVIREFQRIGYESAWGLFSAAEVVGEDGRRCPHQRKRVFLLARKGNEVPPVTTEDCRSRVSLGEIGERAFNELANTRSEGRERQVRQGAAGEEGSANRHAVECRSGVWPSRPGEQQQEWETQPQLGGASYVGQDGCRVDATIDRVDRLRLLGNGVVPATAAIAYRTLLKELER